MKSQTFERDSEILLAVVFGEYRLVTRILKDYEVDAREDDGGRTLLHWAVQENHTNILHLLLQRGANPEALDENGITPFSAAAADGNLRFLKIMRHFGANVSGISNINVPLVMATAWKHARCVRYLLSRGADVNAKEKKGSTALLLAVHHGHHALARFLIQHGARTDVRDESGSLLWELAQENKTPKTTRDLKAGGLTLWEMAEENRDAKMLGILNSK